MSPTLLLLLALAAPPVQNAPTLAEILEKSTPSDWRPLKLENTVYMDLPAGRVVIELAPEFAPRHVANIQAFAREGYFQGLSIVRAQDNYVVQWADPKAGEATAKPLGTAAPRLPAEFDRTSQGLPFIPLPEKDTYAAQTGWSSGFPVARDPKSGQAWLTHCYGMVGSGRDNPPDSSNGAELYAVIGHSPRQLDRNVTLVGRVIQGMELLSTLPRGSGAMGFYERAEERVPIQTFRLASTVPEAEQTPLEIFRTDTPAFARLVESRRNRREPWFARTAGKIDVCNVPLPVRKPQSKAPSSQLPR